MQAGFLAAFAACIDFRSDFHGFSVQCWDYWGLGIGDNQSHNIKHAFFEVGLAHDKIILIEISRRMATSSRSHSLETRLQGFSLCMTGMKAMRR